MLLQGESQAGARRSKPRTRTEAISDEYTGTAPDAKVETKIGRPINAVRSKRNWLGIATARNRRREA
jgi:hypothetical protein